MWWLSLTQHGSTSAVHHLTTDTRDAGVWYGCKLAEHATWRNIHLQTFPLKWLLRLDPQLVTFTVSSNKNLCMLCSCCDDIWAWFLSLSFAVQTEGLFWAPALILRAAKKKQSSNLVFRTAVYTRPEWWGQTFCTFCSNYKQMLIWSYFGDGFVIHKCSYAWSSKPQCILSELLMILSAYLNRLHCRGILMPAEFLWKDLLQEKKCH